MVGNIPKEKQPYVKELTCPNCAASVLIRGGAGSISVVCGSCQTILGLNDPKYKILEVYQQNLVFETKIPLGQRGKLKGIEWEVIGFMQRVDELSGYFWQEYLLFNPYQGYAWLTEAQGHWNFVIMLKQKPQASLTWVRSFKFLGSKYSLFHRGRAHVKYVLGEFYWRVKANESVDVADFICPPYMLSYEGNVAENEFTWSQAEYIDRKEIQASFKPIRDLHYPSGVAPNQPSPVDGKVLPLVLLWVVFFAVLLLMQGIHAGTARRQTVLMQGAEYTKYYSSPQSYVTPSFELTGGVKNVDIEVLANLDNNWLSMDIDLINDKTGDVHSFSKTLETYSGVEGGEYWREGDSKKSTLMSSIPSGTYHLDIEAQGDKPSSFSVTVVRDAVNTGNFFWALLAITVWPLLIFMRHYFFENSRWSESDYAPMMYSGGEE